MLYVNVDDQTKEILFIDPDFRCCTNIIGNLPIDDTPVLISEIKSNVSDIETETAVVGRFPIGDNLISFLSHDFNEYERKRLELLKIFGENTIRPGKMYEAALSLVRQGQFINPLDDTPIDVINYGPLRPDHPYFSRFAPASQLYEKDQVAIDYLEKHDFKRAQSDILTAFQVCLDIDYSDHKIQFNTQERFIIGDITRSFKLPVTEFTSGFTYDQMHRYLSVYRDIALVDSSDHLMGYRQFKDLKPELLAKFRKSFDSIPLTIYDGYFINNPIELATLELIEMIRLGIQVRECENCNQYFVVKREKPSKFCTRIIDGKNTCQKIGLDKKYKMKVESNMLLIEYRRDYNRWYNRLKKQETVSNEDFSRWLDIAQGYRDKANAGKIPEDEAVRWLKDKDVKKIWQTSKKEETHTE